VLHLPQRLTHANASACLQSLLADAQGGSDVLQVDAGRLVEFDSAALAVLLSLRRQAQRQGRRFAVQGLPVRLAELARLYGIAELLPAAGGSGT